MNMSSDKKHLSPWIAFLVLLCLLSPFILLSFFNFPMGDDFWYGYVVRQDGYWAAQREFYTLISPRYTTFALTCLFPLSYGDLYGYKLIPLAAMGLILVALANWFRRTSSGVSPGTPSGGALGSLWAAGSLGAAGTGGMLSARGGGMGMGWKGSLWLGALVLGMYLAIMHGIGEGMYWASAVAGYDTALILFVLWLTRLFEWYGGRRGVGSLVMLGLYLVLMAGCLELMMPICGVVVVLVGLYRWKRRDWLAAGLLVIIIALLLVDVCATGVHNRYRQDQQLHPGRLGYSVGFSVVVVGYCVFRAVVNPFFWVAVVAGTPAFERWSGGVYRRLPLLFGRKARLYVGIGLGAILLMIPFSILYLLGLHPFHRVNNLVSFFLLLGLLYYGICRGRRPEGRSDGGWWGWSGGGGRLGWLKGFGSWVGRRRVVVIVVLLAAGYCLSNNVANGMREIVSGRAHQYDQEEQARFRLVESCPADSCVVPPLRHVEPMLRYDSTDSENPGRYFHKRVIVRGR